MVELLSPAGNFISLRAVLENGADATYFGLDDFNSGQMLKIFLLIIYLKFLKLLNNIQPKLIYAAMLF